jgi:hypothetical protein
VATISTDDEVGVVAGDQVGIEEQEHGAERTVVERVVPRPPPQRRCIASSPILSRLVHNLHAPEASPQERGMQIRE